MPTYDYKCNTCNKVFEHFQSIKDEPLTHCHCEQKGSVSKMISSGSGIIFKGSGFYVNDYKKPVANSSESSSGTSKD
ncbi:MAG: zinc ribbon domain-containing protein [Leptospiraceae bacterium]|nr:zinc ribbon domain-containing protein [Leptospiraceae bacterium]MCP5511924.1 zinc ribbon domain-containing protein [Leptospiraceae bacterium]